MHIFVNFLPVLPKMLMQMRKTVQKPHKNLLLLIACAFAFGLISLPKANAFVVEDFTVHMQIMELHEAKAPYVINDHIILSYQQPLHEQTPRYVAAAFAHEDFRTMHLYKINQHGIFVLALPVPPDHRQLSYRMRIDSIWLSDPSNPEYFRDSAGQMVSIVQIPATPDSMYRVPELDANGNLAIDYHGEPGQEVYLSGTFNNWDPFMHRMNEVRPGVYQIQLKVDPRRSHYYVFFRNGQRILDPRNPQVAYSARDTQVSSIHTYRVDEATELP
ncbi:MAG: hypothetical protein D6B26_05245 [Spirochaetaceae bacterium]|nr:MAG: hypothetical protein D6B26_05245 [Spirochaetaceae bacterium]